MNDEIKDLLVDLEEYFDNCADVDDWQPNEAMKFLDRIQRIIRPDTQPLSAASLGAMLSPATPPKPTSELR